MNSNDKNWQQLQKYLFLCTWKKIHYWHRKMFYDFVFSCIQSNRNLKCDPYLADTAKHLIAISMGVLPGFGVALDNTFAPVNLIQKIYLENYRLKHHVPTLMHTMNSASMEEKRSLYYSLQVPTTLEFSPKLRKSNTTLNELRQIKHILDVYLEEISHNSLNFNDSFISEIAQHLSFDFYHNKPDRYGEVTNTRKMPLKDPSLLKCTPCNIKRTFSDTGAFVRGCVRIVKS